MEATTNHAKLNPSPWEVRVVSEPTRATVIVVDRRIAVGAPALWSKTVSVPADTGWTKTSQGRVDNLRRAARRFAEARTIETTVYEVRSEGSASARVLATESTLPAASAACRFSRGQVVVAVVDGLDTEVWFA